MQDYLGSPPEVDATDLIDELDSVLDRITREEARATKLVARVVATKAYRRDGNTSATAMLKHRNSLNPNAARQMVSRANGLEGSPQVSDWYESGQLTSAQVDTLLNARATAPVPFDDDEAELLRMTLETPLINDLRKRLDYWLQGVAEEEQAWDRHVVREARSLRVRRDGEMISISGWYHSEAGEQVLAALELPPPAVGDRRSIAARRADLLLDILNGASKRPNITVHVSEGQLRDTKMPSISETGTGTFLSATEVDRLACDASFTRVVFGPDSQPLDVGRTKRLVTTQMRVAVIARDRRCVFPGCDRPSNWCDVHHIIHWIKGGLTEINNLVLLCRHHHTLIHDGKWRITGMPGQLQFFRPDGTLLANDRSAPEPETEVAPDSYQPGDLIATIKELHGIHDP